MTPEQWEKISEIFHSAAALESDERSRFLEQACKGDQSLRREVESLIAAADAAPDFISQPAINVAFSPEEAPSLSGAFIGHYRIEKSIGSGGMGEVYLATDALLNRKVAIKRLPFPYSRDPNFISRFRIEAQAAATLNHPNVATVYSVEEFGGKPFITMEFIDGRTLDGMIPKDGLDLKLFLDWFTPLADALRHAHERGVTHRDVKPGNIMISSDGTPKVLDFGLARITTGVAMADSLGPTQPGHVAGTPSYMSPEQAQGKPVDHRSDVFSFGVVMYEALTGARPFNGSSHAEVMSELLKASPAPIPGVRPGVPYSIDQLIRRCLEKRRRDRFQNMREVGTVLAETKAMMETGGSAESFGRRLYRESRPRSRYWLAAAFAVLLLAFTGYFYFAGRTATIPFNFANMTIRRLSQTNNVVFAHITQDGRSVAFNTIEEDEQRALWIRRIEDRNALQLVPPQPVQYWGGLTSSANGDQIYFITAGRDARFGTLFRISSLGGPPRKLVETVNDLGSLSPDDRSILFVRYGDQTQIIAANSSDGSGENVLQSTPSDVILRDPQYSPDGRYIYYIRLDRIDAVEWWSLVRITVGSRDEMVIVPRQKPRINEVVALQDGLLLNAVDPVSNLPQLFHLSLSDLKQTRITNDLNSYFGASADRNGQSVVAAQRFDKTDIWAGDAADTKSLKPVTSEPTVYSSVSWTSDDRIVFDAVENNLPHIRVSSLDGRNMLQLTPNDSSDLQPRVSPDGRYIVFTSDRTGQNKIWRMNIDGSSPVLLTPVDGIQYAARFSPDGQNVLFYWNRATTRLLGSVPIMGGEIKELPLYSDCCWAISPDGHNLAYSFWDEVANGYKVGIRPVEGVLPTKILDISPTRLLQWTRDGKSLLYRDRQAGLKPYATIFKRGVDENESKVFLSAEPDVVTDLAFSLDGKKIAVVRGKLITDAVMLQKLKPE